MQSDKPLSTYTHAQSLRLHSVHVSKKVCIFIKGLCVFYVYISIHTHTFSNFTNMIRNTHRRFMRLHEYFAFYVYYNRVNPNHFICAVEAQKSSMEW